MLIQHERVAEASIYVFALAGLREQDDCAHQAEAGAGRQACAQPCRLHNAQQRQTDAAGGESMEAGLLQSRLLLLLLPGGCDACTAE
jgi:hypothetical protein